MAAAQNAGHRSVYDGLHASFVVATAAVVDGDPVASSSFLGSVVDAVGFVGDVESDLVAAGFAGDGLHVAVDWKAAVGQREERA